MYRAHGPSGPVAIKLLGGPPGLDAATEGRFRREISTLAQLSHPHLVGLLDHGIDPELGPYLVTPLLSGQTLRGLVGGLALCPEAAILLLQPIAEATAALHAAGYVHRDLKPENAIAGPDGAVTVIDLGLAWRDGMTRHTDTGAAVGSVGYMAPEQIEGRAIETSVDVWALGVMLYEWIAGKRPFARPRASEEAAAALVGVYAPLASVDRRATEELSALVAACLAIDPQRRPSASEVAVRLASVIDWTDRVVVERAAVIADPGSYGARVAPFRVRRLERVARDALAAGEPFAALAACDRALAYAPDDRDVIALVAAAEQASARPPAPREVTTPSDAGPRAPVSRWPRRWIIAGSAALVLVGVLVWWATRASPTDPWAGGSTTPSRNEAAASRAADDDRALMHEFVSLFRTAIDATADRPGSSAPETRPSTARGWYELARSQPPAQAVTSIRHALRLSPDWLDAQIVLCSSLAATQDEGAVSACTAALERRPRDPALRGARGVAHLHAGRPNDAIADLDLAIAVDPDPAWRRLRGFAKRAVGDVQGAARDLAGACRLGDAEACRAGP